MWERKETKKKETGSSSSPYSSSLPVKCYFKPISLPMKPSSTKTPSSPFVSRLLLLIKQMLLFTATRPLNQRCSGHGGKPPPTSNFGAHGWRTRPPGSIHQFYAPRSRFACRPSVDGRCAGAPSPSRGCDWSSFRARASASRRSSSR